jgi:rare lipoprotein A (peptidoglycan hydrolase)
MMKSTCDSAIIRILLLVILLFLGQLSLGAPASDTEAVGACVECQKERSLPQKLGQIASAIASETICRPIRTIRGKASYYGKNDGFEGQLTSSSEPFDPEALTAAHKKLPMHTRVLVRNLKTGNEVIVTVNDRGPYKKGRIIDLSYRAAQLIGFAQEGIADVEVKVCAKNKSGS